MGSKSKNTRNKKSKPVDGGVKIQSMVSVPTARKGSWRVLMLLLDDSEKKERQVVDEEGKAKFFFEDVACFALVVEEDSTKKYQEIWPCIATEGLVQPVNPSTTNYVGVVPPSYDAEDVAEMIDGLADELDMETIEESDDTDDSDDDKEEESDE